MSSPPSSRRRSGTDDGLAHRAADLGRRGRRADRVGRHRRRQRPRPPAMPPLRPPHTDFLGALRRAGVDPADVDVVVNTHLHSDHVGWNTMRDGDSWVPTFPERPLPDSRGRLPPLQSGRRRHRSTPRTEDEQARQDHGRTVFADSISPVRRADRAVVRRPSAQRVASATSCAGPHPGIVGAVAGRRQARRVRRRPDPLPDPVAPAG